MSKTTNINTTSYNFVAFSSNPANIVLTNNSGSVWAHVSGVLSLQELLEQYTSDTLQQQVEEAKALMGYS